MKIRILQVDLANHFSRKLKPFKHFYSSSQPGTGKTTGLLMGIFQDLIMTDPCMNNQYVIFTSTYDMAYATYRLAEDFQKQFPRKLVLGFISKEANDLQRRLTTFDIIIGTPNEIFAKLDEVHNIKNVVFDDADAYLSWRKMEELMAKIPNATYTVVSITHVPEILRTLPATETFVRHHEWNDNLIQYVEIVCSQPSMDFEYKIKAISSILKKVNDICPSGQILIFCRVSMRNHHIKCS